MPTARGWFVAVTGATLAAVGVAFGARPLEQAGTALMIIVLAAIGVVRLGKHELSVERTIVPERSKARQEVTITLSLHNRGESPAPPLLIEDGSPPRLAARSRFTAGGIEAGGRRQASYSVRPEVRGRYEIGPLTVSSVDPFGLAQITVQAAPVQSFLVHPRTEPLVLPRDPGDRRGLSTSAVRQPTGAQGEDFYALREYVQGDDLRKVHWPSTAKRGKVMIRQEETPWHTRATIVLDDRASAYARDPAFAERAVEAAASLVELYHGAGYGFRLSGAHHPGLPTGRGSLHLHRCLDVLATLAPAPRSRSRSDDLLVSRLAEIEAGGGPEETLILVTGTIEEDIAAMLSRLHRLFKQIVVVSFPPYPSSSAPTERRWETERATTGATRALARSGIRCLVVGPERSLASAWNQATGARPGGGAKPWAQRPELV